MTNDQLETEMDHLVRSERKITTRILMLINECEDRRLFLERGYGSLRDWLVKRYKYSHPAAQRRISAAKLLRAVPGAESKLESGEVNLSTLSIAQSIIRTEEARTGGKVTDQEKAAVIAAIENKLCWETQQELGEISPEARPKPDDNVKPVNKSESRAKINFDNEMLEDLKRIKELLSHTGPTNSSVVKRALKELRNRLDPLRKKAATHRAAD